MTVMDDFLEPNKLRCKRCKTKFMTVLPIGNIKQGNVHCPKCNCSRHDILDEPKPDFLAKTINIPTTRNTSSDLYDSLLYAAQEINKINMEDKNMKRTVNEEKKDQNIVITRRCDTSRGIFTVSQLEPTDMFALIDDEDQTVYMAVYEENPKYKTKQAVVNMHNGNLLYLDLSTKIHVYRAGCELRVGEFIWSSEGCNGSRVEI